MAWSDGRPRARIRASWREVALALLPVAIIALSVLVHVRTLNQPLLETYGFRQTQTAYTARVFHESGIDLLHSQMPVMGPPWEVPFELPLFQAAASLVMDVGVAEDRAMRLTGLATFVLSAGAINSAALLLRSANDKHPRGLANSSDVVGRHYMGHTNSVMMAISKCPNPTIFQKTLGVNDFYFGSKDFEYPMGHISFVGKLDAITLKAGAPAIAPNFTLELMAKHSLDFWLTSEDLPDPNNRVTIGRDGKIVMTYTPNNLEAHEQLKSKLKQVMKQTNCTMHGHDCHQGLFGRNLYVGQQIPLAGVAHQNGTIRFGQDPKTSVLDVNCKAHDVDNLYVVDGSFFPSSAAVNPALTIMANALRVGDHLMKRLGVSETTYEQNRQQDRELAVSR